GSDVDVRSEAGLGRLFRVGLEIIDAADAVEDVEVELRIVMQETAHFKEVARLDDDERIDGLEVLGLDFGPELRFEFGDNFSGSHNDFQLRRHTPCAESPHTECAVYITLWSASLFPCSFWRKRAAFPSP